MDDSVEDIVKGRIRLAIVALALVLLIGAGIWLGRPPYRSWKERWFVTEAQAFMAKGDYANGSLCARQAPLPLKLGDVVFARIHNMLIINDLGCTFALVPPLTWGCNRLSTTFPIISPRSSRLCALSCATKTSWLAIACDRKISPANAN